MLRPTDPLIFDPPFAGDGPLLDRDAIDAFEAPRRLSRDEGRAAAGPDWVWTHPASDEESEND